jgi:hypothetical protein
MSKFSVSKCVCGSGCIYPLGCLSNIEKTSADVTPLQKMIGKEKQKPSHSKRKLDASGDVDDDAHDVESRKKLREEMGEFNRARTLSFDRILEKKVVGNILERFIMQHEDRRRRQVERITKDWTDEVDAAHILAKRVRTDPPLKREELDSQSQYTEEDNKELQQLSRATAEVHYRARLRVRNKIRAYTRVHRRSPMNDDEVDYLFLKYSH